MTKILLTVVAFFSSHISKLKEIRMQFSIIEENIRVCLLKKSESKPSNFKLSFVITLALLFFVSFANAATFINKDLNGNWNNIATWNSSRTGTITATAGSTAVTGSGFSTQLVVGNVLYQNDGITIIGTVASITDDTHLTLSSSAPATLSSVPYMANATAIPGPNDNVTVVAGSNIVLNMDITIGTGRYIFKGNVTDDATPNKLIVTTAGGSLQISNNSTTTFGGTATWGIQGNGVFPSVTVDAGSSLITGALTLDNKATVSIAGSLTVNGNLTNNDNTGTFSLTGFIQVNGNYSAPGGSIDIGGGGVLQTTGTIDTQGGSGINGITNNCNVGPCSSANLACGTAGFSYSSAVSPLNQVLCTGQTNINPIIFSTNAPATLTYQWESSTASGGSGFTPIPGPGTTGSSYTPPVPNPLVTTWYRVRYSSSNGGTVCSDLISPSSQISFSNATAPVAGTIGGGNVTYCNNTNATTMTLSGYTGTIQWQSSSNNITFANISGQTTASYSVSSVTSTTYYRVVVSNGACNTVNSASVVILRPPGTNSITLTSAAGTDAQILCIGAPITPITYTVTGTTGVTVTDLPAGVSGSLSGNTVTISGTPIASGVALTYTINFAGGCGSTVNKTGTITVSPANAITLTSAAGTDTQISCINAPITPIIYTVTGTAVATVTNLPAGVSYSLSGNTVTISGTPTTAGSFTYSIPLTGGCGGGTATGTIIVVNTAAIIPTLSNVEIACSATSFQLASLTAAAGVTDYRIDVSTDSGFTNIIRNDISLGFVSPETTAVTGLNKGGTYYIRARAVTGCGTTASSAYATVSAKSTIYNGTSWAPFTPDVTLKAIFTGNATITSKLEACSCQIDAGANVVVGVPGGDNANAVLKIENGLNVLGTLTFENNASLIQTTNTTGLNSGSINYKRETTAMKNLDFTRWCSPVAGQTIGALLPLSTKTYSWGTDNWITGGPGTVMDPPGKGFTIRMSSGVVSGTATAIEKVQFVGVPNNGPYSLPGNSIAGQYNLIGNPYPSALSADAFLLANSGLANSVLEGTLYFWTHNTAATSAGYSSADYATYNFTGGVRTAKSSTSLGNNAEPSGFIAAGEGFFAITKNSGSIVFNNAMRIGASNTVLDNSQFFRGTKSKTTAVEKHRVWLNLTNTGGAFKQMLVGYISGATAGYDSAFDGENFNGNSFVNFYSINGEKTFTIEGRGLPFDTNDQVPLGYSSTIAGTFDISIDHADGSLINQPVYVEDKMTNVIHNLKNGSYSFSTAKGTFDDRFVLRYSDKAVVESTLGNQTVDEKEKGLVVSVKNHSIKINSFDETIDNVALYDLKGSLLYEKDHVGTSEFIIPNFNSSDQFLIVMVQLSNGKWITKEIVF